PRVVADRVRKSREGFVEPAFAREPPAASGQDRGVHPLSCIGLRPGDLHGQWPITRPATRNQALSHATRRLSLSSARESSFETWLCESPSRAPISDCVRPAP